MGKGLAFLNLKAAHPGSQKNRSKLRQAKFDHSQELRKMAILQQERKKEIHEEEIRALQYAHLPKEQRPSRKTAWMYAMKDPKNDEVKDAEEEKVSKFAPIFMTLEPQKELMDKVKEQEAAGSLMIERSFADEEAQMEAREKEDRKFHAEDPFAEIFDAGGRFEDPNKYGVAPKLEDRASSTSSSSRRRHRHRSSSSTSSSSSGSGSGSSSGGRRRHKGSSSRRELSPEGASSSRSSRSSRHNNSSSSARSGSSSRSHRRSSSRSSSSSSRSHRHPKSPSPLPQRSPSPSWKEYPERPRDVRGEELSEWRTSRRKGMFRDAPSRGSREGERESEGESRRNQGAEPSCKRIPSSAPPPARPARRKAYVPMSSGERESRLDDMRSSAASLEASRDEMRERAISEKRLEVERLSKEGKRKAPKGEDVMGGGGFGKRASFVKKIMEDAAKQSTSKQVASRRHYSQS